MPVDEIEDLVIYGIYGQKRDGISDLQGTSYSNEEQRGTELTKENEKGGRDQKVDMDLDVVISEKQDNLRFWSLDWLLKGETSNAVD